MGSWLSDFGQGAVGGFGRGTGIQPLEDVGKRATGGWADVGRFVGGLGAATPTGQQISSVGRSPTFQNIMGMSRRKEPEKAQPVPPFKFRPPQQSKGMDWGKVASSILELL
jgi:hypothetical protein